jgi:hypothetical protein
MKLYLLYFSKNKAISSALTTYQLLFNYIQDTKRYFMHGAIRFAAVGHVPFIQQQPAARPCCPPTALMDTKRSFILGAIHQPPIIAAAEHREMEHVTNLMIQDANHLQF